MDISSDKQGKKSAKGLFGAAGFFGGLTATLCCVAPVVLVLLGFGTAFSMMIMHHFHTISIVSGLVFMVLVILFAVKRDTGSCSVDGFKKKGPAIALTILFMVISYFAINYLVIEPVAAMVYGDLEVEQKPLGNLPEMAELHQDLEMAAIEVIPENLGMKRVDLKVDGSFCGSCGPAIEFDIKSISGVTEVEATDGGFFVTYDSDVTSKDVLVASVHSPYSASIRSEEELS
jgi:copper chaperone CopZ